ncbi:MAG: zinc metalloprotease [Planctomycetota bacterium]
MKTAATAACIVCFAGVAIAQSAAPRAIADAQPLHRWAQHNVQFHDNGTVTANGQVWDSADAYIASDYFQANGLRCPVAFTEAELIEAEAFALRGSTADCSSGSTSILPEYDPATGDVLRIPVVVHVIQNTGGTGFISESRVQSQIDILNEDFRALPGTNGAPGADTGIEFFLATEDPGGNPTNGITYSTNNTWFNDGGSYWNSLAWDPNRYLNIYTNSASGNLGYVPFLPQTNPGAIGSNSDRAVVLHSSFGRNAPIANYDLGRTATHEVGHYLGLFHTFQSGCGSASSCYTTGDRICDTNPENSPFFGCSAGRSTCGSSDPIDNYMDYSYDVCMNKFTPEQANRMRCTLFNYRSSLYVIDAVGPCSPADVTTDATSNGEPDGAVTLSDFSFYLSLWSSGDAAADITTISVCNPGAGGDGVDLSDFSCYLATWSDGCP